MKPPWFDYHAPDTLDEALSLLGDAGFDGRVLAGGQSLMPMMNMRILNPSVLVDINRIEELANLETDAHTLRVGALVRHADILKSEAVRSGWPLLAEATTQVAHPTIRNRGTVCGSISHNDPAAEHPSIISTLDGTIVTRSASGGRQIPAEDFFDGLMSTALEEGEMVVEVRYPRPPENASFGFCEFARRLGDFAIAGAAVMLTSRDGVCESARITIVGMGEGPFRATAAEEAMVGRDIAPDARKAAASEAAQEVVMAVDPAEDVHASSSYRRHLAGIMTQRALTSAMERAEAN